MKVKGQYTNGIGKASIVAKTPGRRALLAGIFGCPLYGTFNIRTDRDIRHFPPGIIRGIHRFNFIKISLPDGRYRYGWSYRWDGSRQKGDILEVYTKSLLPPEFKTRELEITFFSRWTTDQILQWQKGKYWFQGFDWLPVQRADSQRIWKLLSAEDYRQKTILDFGTHYGYFAFQASKKGGVVEAVDQAPENIRMATTINENIEHQDILFCTGDTLPDKEYDYIFELSVYHWIDRSYHDLSGHLTALKQRCRTLFIELINPPLEGRLSPPEVDKIVGGEKLLHYRHKVRRTRTLYKINGSLA